MIAVGVLEKLAVRGIQTSPCQQQLAGSGIADASPANGSLLRSTPDVQENSMFAQMVAAIVKMPKKASDSVACHASSQYHVAAYVACMQPDQYCTHKYHVAP